MVLSLIMAVVYSHIHIKFKFSLCIWEKKFGCLSESVSFCSAWFLVAPTFLQILFFLMVTKIPLGLYAKPYKPKVGLGITMDISSSAYLSTGNHLPFHHILCWLVLHIWLTYFYPPWLSGVDLNTAPFNRKGQEWWNRMREWVLGFVAYLDIISNQRLYAHTGNT